MTRKLSPAEYIIEQFNGVGKTAIALGMTKGAVSKWQSKHKPPRKRLVPGWHHARILELAKQRGLDIRPEHFIYIG